MRPTVFGILVVFLAFAAYAGAEEDISPPATLTFQDGDYVTFSGFPLGVELSDRERTAVLRFTLATRDLSLPCYENGTNVWVLRDLRSRLDVVNGWNGKRMLRGEAPAQVTVEGWFDAAQGYLRPNGIILPRIVEAATPEAIKWDRFNPNQGDSLPSYGGGYAEVEYDRLYPLPEEFIAEQGPLAGENAVSPFQPPLEYPTRYYPSVEYEPPYTYRVRIPNGQGIGVDGSYFYSGPDSYYSWEDYYNDYYPLIEVPVHRYLEEPDGQPGGDGNGGGDGEDSGGGDEVGDGGDEVTPAAGSQSKGSVFTGRGR